MLHSRTSLLLLALLVASPALADPPAPANEDAARQEAKALAESAKEQRAAGEARGALDLYRKAYRIYPSPYLLWPMAELCLETNQPREGLEFLRRHREGFPQSGYPERQGTDEIRALEQKLTAQLSLQGVRPSPLVRPAPRTLPPPAPRSFWHRHRLSLGLGGLAVALAVAGVGVGISTWRSYADLTPTCAGGPSGCPPDDVASIQDRALATNILFGLAGGTALIAGGVFLFGERRPAAAPKVTVGPGHGVPGFWFATD